MGLGQIQKVIDWWQQSYIPFATHFQLETYRNNYTRLIKLMRNCIFGKPANVTKKTKKAKKTKNSRNKLRGKKCENQCSRKSVLRSKSGSDRLVASKLHSLHRILESFILVSL